MNPQSESSHDLNRLYARFWRKDLAPTPITRQIDELVTSDLVFRGIIPGITGL